MVFHTGIFITPLLGGWVMEIHSLSAYILLLVALALGTSLGTSLFRDDR